MTATVYLDDEEHVLSLVRCGVREDEVGGLFEEVLAAGKEEFPGGKVTLNMSQNRWGGEGAAGMVLRAAEENFIVRKVDVSGSEFTQGGFEKMTQAVKTVKATHVNIENSTLPKQYPPHLTSLVTSPDVASLNISSIPQTGLIFKMLRPKTPLSLTSLHVSSISMKPQELLCLKRLIDSRHLRLSTLSISSNNLPETALKDFFDVSATLGETLTTLDISRQILSVEILEAMAVGLVGLTNIDLSRCASEGSVEWAAAAGKICSSAKKVNLTKVNFKEPEILTFLTSSTVARTLETLKLNYNKLSASPTEVLNILSTAPCLTSLSLTGMKLPEGFLECFTQSKGFHNLKNLYLSRNHWKDTTSRDPVQKLCDLITQLSPTLETLYLEEVSCVKPSLIAALIEALNKCSELRCLSVAGNFIKPQNMVEIVNGLRGGKLRILNIRPAPRGGGGTERERQPMVMSEQRFEDFFNAELVRRQLTTVKMEGVCLRGVSLVRLSNILRVRKKLKVFLEYPYAGGEVSLMNFSERVRFANDPFTFFDFLENKHETSHELNLANLDLSTFEKSDIAANFIIKNHQYIHSLNLSNCKLTDFTPFTNLFNSPDLGVINITGNILDEDAAATLQSALTSTHAYEVVLPVKYGTENVVLKGVGVVRRFSRLPRGDVLNGEVLTSLGAESDVVTGLTAVDDSTVGFSMTLGTLSGSTPSPSVALSETQPKTLVLDGKQIYLDPSPPNLLGQGSFGSVYKSMCLTTSKLVAVKTLPLPQNTPSLAPLLQEADLMKRLSHPCIVSFYGCTTDETHLFIIMECMENALSIQVKKTFGSSTTVPDLLLGRWGNQVVSGIQYLHEQGVVHSDIKPSNILFDGRDGRCKLSDFGCSKQLDGLASGIQGTPAYISPEALRTNVTAKPMDIWAFGCTLLELHSRSPPWSERGLGGNYHALLLHIVTSETTPHRPPTVSLPLSEALDGCLQRDPEGRMSPSELLALPLLASGGDF